MNSLFGQPIRLQLMFSYAGSLQRQHSCLQPGHSTQRLQVILSDFPYLSIACRKFKLCLTTYAFNIKFPQDLKCKLSYKPDRRQNQSLKPIQYYMHSVQCNKVSNIIHTNKSLRLHKRLLKSLVHQLQLSFLSSFVSVVFWSREQLPALLRKNSSSHMLLPLGRNKDCQNLHRGFKVLTYYMLFCVPVLSRRL